ncbi:unnamed protein product [Psylliodes chrysocephalus]|uniref:Major facilitator superfamily (MFS) profile domain-containing protein n=1 Tax=Psylliodes chrysocephalus TaxID=3402493 RepID=A0A9P0D8M2_9CUCU|nr:unnamed protein product [Psylliodes chrysocephala]
MAWYNKITVEVPLLIVLSSFMLMGPIMTNLMIYRTCYVTMGYNESKCALLGQDTSPEIQELEKIVQPTANILTLILDLPLNILPIITCLFAGPWSDKFGRIPVQLMALTGLTFSFALLAILTCIKNLSPWYFMIATIPAMLTGSVPTYFTVVLSYLNDISTKETRGLRMVIYEAVMLCGLLIGSLSSAPLLYATNYETVFFIATGTLAIGTLYTMFFLAESVQVKKTEENNLKETFKCTYIADMVKVVCKKRGKWDRVIIIIIILSITLINFTTNGIGIVRFQFLRKKLTWTLEKFNYFNCFSHIVTIIGTVMGTMLLNKVFKIKETVVALLGLFSIVGCCLLWGSATKDGYIYLGSFVAILSGSSSPMLRTRIAQIVPPEDMGKIFSVIIGIGGVVGVGSTYLFTMVYNATINFNSGSFNFLAAVLYTFAIFLVGAVVIFEVCTPKNKETYEVEGIENDSTKEPTSMQFKQISDLL